MSVGEHRQRLHQSSWFGNHWTDIFKMISSMQDPSGPVTVWVEEKSNEAKGLPKAVPHSEIPKDLSSYKTLWIRTSPIPDSSCQSP